MAASNASNEQRLVLREDLKRQLANMRAMQEAAEKAKAEQQELLTRIAAMESKVQMIIIPSRAALQLKPAVVPGSLQAALAFTHSTTGS
jgi:hypothetical protein